MPIFTYRAKKDPENTITGEIEAEDVSSAAARLKKLDLFPFLIKKKGERFFHRPALFLAKNINSQDINIFIRQLSDLIHAGLPLAKALNSLSLQTSNRYLKTIIEDVEHEIRKGKSFHDALAKYSKIFSLFFLNIVKVGETGGILDEALKRLAEIRNREEDLKIRLRGALTYPILLIIVSIMTVFVLLTFIIPRFAGMFEELGQVLPWPTRILLGLSGFLNKWCLLLLVFIIGLIIIFRKYAFTEKGLLLIDKIKLRIPLLGEILKEIEIARFTRTLGTLLKNDVPILEALKVASETVGNKIFEKETKVFLGDIEKGKKLSAVMRKTNCFPSSVTDLVGVGEESANLEGILIDISNSFEKESEVRIKTFVSILEPVLILILGAIVALVVISMLLPIFEIDILLK